MRVCEGLSVSPDVLFENIVPKTESGAAQEIYNIAASLPTEKQQALLDIVEKIADIV